MPAATANSGQPRHPDCMRIKLANAAGKPATPRISPTPSDAVKRRLVFGSETSWLGVVSSTRSIITVESRTSDNNARAGIACGAQDVQAKAREARNSSRFGDPVAMARSRKPSKSRKEAAAGRRRHCRIYHSNRSRIRLLLDLLGCIP